MQLLESARCFGGEQRRYQHASRVLQCAMTVSVYLPPAADDGRVATLLWLSGLTCTDQNFVTKAGAQRMAAQLGMAIIAPDTSPRGDSVPDAPDAAYDLGLGAGFYLDASEQPWSRHYRMESYLTQELLPLVAASTAVDLQRLGISGHSMGGHGAITLALRHPDLFHSMSAFAPICAPSQCPWGQKAFSAYLGSDEARWLEHDSAHLIASASIKRPLLIDQGEADGFLHEQLRPELMERACTQTDYPLQLRRHAGYDHSYFFISSFIDDHLLHHYEQLSG